MTAPTSGQAKDPIQRLRAWYEAHRRLVVGSFVLVVVLAAGTWFYVSAKERKARFARAALDDARTAAQAGNLPLAASDLSRLLQSYHGTPAADEAAILLGQIRLLQGDDTTAAQELRRAITQGVGDQFRAQAYGLLGAALENLGKPADAASAYLSAADAAWYEYLSAQYLTDAGRAFAIAGDTARATQAYQRILDKYDDSPSAAEARVRLSELTASQRALGG